MRGSQLPGRAALAPRSRFARAGAVWLALAVVTPAGAGQVTAPFAVSVNLDTSGACASVLESPARPSTLVIDCREPIPLVQPPNTRSPTQAFRFHIPSSDGYMRSGNVDLYAGAGTITSWRIVNLAGWDYLEMTVGW